MGFLIGHNRPTSRQRRRAWWRWAVFAAVVPLAAWAVVAACDRGQPGQAGGGGRHGKSQVATQVASKPPELPKTRPSTQPALASEPQMASFLYFQDPQSPQDGQGEGQATPANAWGTPRQFPPARLRLRGGGDEPVVALLFSDDPKGAIENDWAGDRYYFEMKLPANDLARLDGIQWGYQVSSAAADREESPNGIYLKGDRYHLEPGNVAVRFEGRAPNMTVWIGGWFLQYDKEDPAGQPKQVLVRGVLVPKVDTKD
jgi:hypothetical protein